MNIVDKNIFKLRTKTESKTKDETDVSGDYEVRYESMKCFKCKYYEENKYFNCCERFGFSYFDTFLEKDCPVVKDDYTENKDNEDGTIFKSKEDVLRDDFS